ncbi:MAG TPA: hypothetical protein DCM28_11450 [Phycisphaerales bacterium]|nr:hypothetical protein [Phycisphaerales bacterium]HCD32534.1 hypothetical protein [Phycisphaerales bacterium]
MIFVLLLGPQVANLTWALLEGRGANLLMLMLLTHVTIKQHAYHAGKTTVVSSCSLYPEPGKTS